MDPFFTGWTKQSPQEQSAQWTMGRVLAGMVIAIFMMASMAALVLIVLDRLPTGMALS